MRHQSVCRILAAAALIMAVTGCDRKDAPQSAAASTDAPAGAPVAPSAKPEANGDREFVAKASPEEAVIAWMAALKAEGIAAHDRCSLNEQNFGEPKWQERASSAIDMIKSDTFYLRKPIVHEGYAAALLKKPGAIDRICLVKASDGWCVLASVSTWESAGMARYGDGTALNAMNLKVMEAQMAAMK